MEGENGESTYRSSDLQKNCFDFFADPKKRNRFYDVVFIAGSERIHAHRIIVVATVPYFRDKLTTYEVPVPDVDPCALQSLIDFLYCCELKISKDNVKQLLIAAFRLGMGEVLNACCDYLAEHLLPETVVNYRQLAEELRCCQLNKTIDQYVTENFVRVSQTEDFLILPFNYIKKLIKKDDLIVEAEERVMEAVLKWIRASPNDRMTKLPELLPDIRLTQLKPRYLKTLAETEDLIKMSNFSVDLIDEAMNSNSFPMRPKKTCPFNLEPRQFIKATWQAGKYRIYRIHGKLVHFVQPFDCIKKKVLAEVKQSCGMTGGYVTELTGRMYCFRWGDALQYKAKDERCHCLVGPRVPRIHAGATPLENKIYICGGYAGAGNILNSVECLDPTQNEWVKINSLHTARWGLNAITLGENIYVIGGRDMTTVYNCVERYSAVTGKWTNITPMQTKRCFAAATAMNGKIYVCGGYSNPSGHPAIPSVEVYDPITNKWTYIAAMKVARCEFDVLDCRGELYALGGNKSKWKNLYTCEIYDPKLDRWTFGPAIDTDDYQWNSVVM